MQGKLITRVIIVLLLMISGQKIVIAQADQVNFSTIPKNGTILIYAHSDDDLIWMLPFWNKTEKFIGGVVPSSPNYRAIIRQQQTFIYNNEYNIDYESNWYTPWDDITDQEYAEYYLLGNQSYKYLATDHIEGRLYSNYTELSRNEINKIKAKIEQFFADPTMKRVVTHNNWGEYGHRHHIGLNKAVRELAVKYRKDVWMLGCDNGSFVDVTVPNGISWTYGSFNTPALYTGIRKIYQNNYRWTWSSTYVPSGDHKFIKIVTGGSDKSDILKGDEITYPGPSQLESGAYIFDGNDDYMTLEGNNNPHFTIAMRIRPDQIRNMDICAMSEYPLSSKNDRNLFLESNGKVSARIYDGSSRSMTSTAIISAGTWSHIAITGNGSSFKLYINGVLDKTISSGNAISDFSTPEFILGQATRTGSYFSGQISEVKLYNYIMTDMEIAEIGRNAFSIISNSVPGGSIKPSGNTMITKGTDKSYSITPATGYSLSEVLIDNLNQGAITSYTFMNVVSDHTISATFSRITYTISSVAGMGGSITPTGETIVNHGSSAAYQIVPNTGFQISDVKIDNVSVGALSSYTFNNIISSHTISATFTPLTFTVNSNSSAGGSISPFGTINVTYGTDIVCSINSDIGYHIADVIINNMSIGPVSKLTLNNISKDHSITANFSINQYTLHADATLGGSVSPGGKTILNHGSDLNYSFTPDYGYKITDVKIDGISKGAVTSYSFKNITDNHILSVGFSPKIIYSIVALPESGGSINPSESITLYEGSEQVYNIIPDYGFRILDVMVDNQSVGALPEYIFNNMNGSHNITARFTSSIDVSVYPNPFTNEFKIYFDTPEGYLIDMSVSDMSGKTVYSQNKLAGNTIIPVNLQVSKGLYLINLYFSGKKIKTIKIVKS